MGLLDELVTNVFERLDEMNTFDDVNRIKADLSDSTSIQSAIKQSQPDEIYNLAAQSFVGLHLSNQF